jgi:hypothetical protein
LGVENGNSSFENRRCILGPDLYGTRQRPRHTGWGASGILLRAAVAALFASQVAASPDGRPLPLPQEWIRQHGVIVGASAITECWECRNVFQFESHRHHSVCGLGNVRHCLHCNARPIAPRGTIFHRAINARHKPRGTGQPASLRRTGPRSCLIGSNGTAKGSHCSGQD